VATWYLLLLLTQWCLILPPRDGTIRHRKTWIRLKRFLAIDWENLQEEFFLQAQVLSTSLNSICFPQHDPPTHKRLFHSLAFGCVREYSWTSWALAPFSPTPTSFDTTSALTTLHFKSSGYFLFFYKDYEPNQDLELSFDSFKLALQCMQLLSASGPFGTVFEHLCNSFHLEDSVSGFLQLFQLCFHIA